MTLSSIHCDKIITTICKVIEPRSIIEWVNICQKSMFNSSQSNTLYSITNIYTIYVEYQKPS